MALPIAEALAARHRLADRVWAAQRIRVIAAAGSSHRRRPRGRCASAPISSTPPGLHVLVGCIQALRCHQNTCPTGAVTTHNPRLQRGLVVEEKYLRVANYAIGMNKEIDMIAHACGCRHARDLKREHVRIVQTAGHSAALNILYPTRPRTRSARPPDPRAAVLFPVASASAGLAAASMC